MIPRSSPITRGPIIHVPYTPSSAATPSSATPSSFTHPTSTHSPYATPYTPDHEPAPRHPCGYPSLDALDPWRPGTLTLLEGMRHATRRIITGLLAHASTPTLVVDGGHNVDVHTLVQAAKRAGDDPELVIDRAHIARAFTAYQLQALIEDEIPRFLEEVAPEGGPDAQALVIVPSFTSQYLDEDIPRREATVLAERAIRTLTQEADAHAVPLIVTAERFASASGRDIGERLRENVGEIVNLAARANRRRNDSTGLIARFPRRGSAYFLPPHGTRQNILDDYVGIPGRPLAVPETSFPEIPELVHIAGPPMIGRVGTWGVRAARVRAEIGLNGMGMSYVGAR